MYLYTESQAVPTHERQMCHTGLKMFLLGSFILE